jgi:hypothetical protein
MNEATGRDIVGNIEHSEPPPWRTEYEIMRGEKDHWRQQAEGFRQERDDAQQQLREAVEERDDLRRELEAERSRPAWGYVGDE